MTPIPSLRSRPAITSHPAMLALRRLFKNPASVLGLGLILLMLGSAVFASWITPYSPVLGDLANDYVKPPSYQHIFGTDEIGRDIFTRVVYGARISLKIALLAQAIALTIGIAVGMITGFFGGKLVITQEQHPAVFLQHNIMQELLVQFDHQPAALPVN